MFTPVATGDGSSTFYSERFGEWFHSRQGAYHEAQATYVETAQIAALAKAKAETAQPLRILDVCYGLGYNTAAALEAVLAANPRCPVEVQALELDPEVPKSAIAQGLTQAYSPPVQTLLNAVAAQGTAQINALSVHMHWGDARQTIQTLAHSPFTQPPLTHTHLAQPPFTQQQWLADVIFFDPFSPPHCPQLWTVEFFQQVARCLHPQTGQLITYSCAAAVRTGLLQAGLSIGSVHTSARRWPGTLARHPHPEAPWPLPPLSQQEQEHLETRAAVPYRDPTLTATATDILTRRAQEQSISKLKPTGPWRKRWKAIALEAAPGNTPQAPAQPGT